MIQSLKNKLFPVDSKPVTVTLNRSVMVGGKPFEAGEVIQVSNRIAGELVAQGSAVNPAAIDEMADHQRSLESLLPAPIEPKPLPDSWKALPPGFSNWWALNQSGLVLENRAYEIEDRLIQRLRKFMVEGDLRSLENVPNQASKSALIKAVAGGIFIGELPQSYHRECEFLRDANERAQQAVTDWRESNGTDLYRLKLQCSDAIFSTHGELSKTARDLASTGKDIFRVRVSALQLHENKINSLFDGSADCQRYATPAVIPGLPDLKSMWHQDNGRDQRLIVNQPVPVLASLWHQYSERNRELSALLKVAKSELAKAQKASSAPALPA